MGRQEDPALCGQLVPLPSQEAGAAAELDKELPFAEPVGLHHLAEGLIGWQQGRKRRRQTLDTVKIPLFSTCQAPMAHQAVPALSYESFQCKSPARPRWHWGTEHPLSLSDKGEGVPEGAMGGCVLEGPRCACEPLPGHCWWLLRAGAGRKAGFRNVV